MFRKLAYWVLFGSLFLSQLSTIGQHTAVSEEEIFAFTVKELNNVSKKGSLFSIPTPGGTYLTVKLFPNNTISKSLASQYPLLRTFSGYVAQAPQHKVSVERTSKGLEAIIYEDEPFTVSISHNKQRIAYSKNRTFEHSEEFTHSACHTEDLEALPKRTVAKSYIPQEIQNKRIFRLAATCTGEFTQYHGGTRQDAIDAIIVAVNRINLIFSNDLGIELELLQADTLIYLDGDSDPYTNDDAGEFVDETEDVIESLISSSSYDIGHGFSTGNAGRTILGSACGNSKARCVSGNPNPDNDDYYIKLLAHIIAHQFNATHTFNGNAGDCVGARFGLTAFEVGSGSTILAYPGRCQEQNLVENTDDYFHINSIARVKYELATDLSSCGTEITTNNSLPEITIPEGGFTIPKGTPFVLEAGATDIDDDVLTYCWEQYDLGRAGHPDTPDVSAPLFRSFPPTLDTKRYFPQLSDIVNNTSTLGEILPQNSRSLNLMFTVRDNNVEVGGIASDLLSFEVSGDHGPFVITNPNISDTVIINDSIIVEWDVANTDQNPINCRHVDIYLSTDGGYTYPRLLKQGTDNDGVDTVIVPNLPTSEARIMVKASDNVFFDISNQNFSIIPPIDPDFVFSTDTDKFNICGLDTLSFNLAVSIEPLSGFDELITLDLLDLPRGLTAQFERQQVLAPDTVEIKLIITDELVEGDYDVVFTANSASVSHQLLINLDYRGLEPFPFLILEPQNNDTVSAHSRTFAWSSSSNVGEYEVQISRDEQFNDIVHQIFTEEHLIDDSFPLLPATNYFWRVIGSNVCGAFTTQSTTFITMEPRCFETNINTSFTFSAVNRNFESSYDVEEYGNLTSIAFVNVQGEHANFNDLNFSITAPDGSSYVLLENACDTSLLYNISFSDLGINYTNSLCPLNDAVVLKPQDRFSQLLGSNVHGTWTFSAYDSGKDDNNSIDSWGLKLCYEPSYGVIMDTTSQISCSGNRITFPIQLIVPVNLLDPLNVLVLNLPTNISSNFTNRTYNQNSDDTLELIIPEDYEPGEYTFDMFFSGTSFTRTLSIKITITDSSSKSYQPLSPQNNADELPLSPTFKWLADETNINYTLEISTDSLFESINHAITIVTDTSYTADFSLKPSTKYYWRVLSDQSCGNHVAPSKKFSFTTSPVFCETYTAENLPLSLPVVGSAVAHFPVYGGPLQSIKVKNIAGTHEWFGDLTATLISPHGDSVLLFSEPCSGIHFDLQNFNFTLSENGLPYEQFSCPPIDGSEFQAQNSFSALINDTVSGLWTILFEDQVSFDGGELENIELEICSIGDPLASIEIMENSNNWHIYPNPVKGMLQIQSSEGPISATVSIYGITGQLIIQKLITEQSSELDMRMFPQGVYTIHISEKRGFINKRFIKID